MEIALIILRQLVIMFIYIAIGVALFRKKLITESSSKALANMLIYVVLPCVIFKSFCTERTTEKTHELIISVIGAFVILMVSIIIAQILFKKNPIENIGVAYSAAGFIGLPVITQGLNADYIFYAVGFVALLNILQATHGQYVMSGSDKNLISFKTVATNPIVISAIIGALVYFCGISVPSIIYTTVSSVSSMNAPLAMIIIGVYMAQADLKKMVTSPRAYYVSFVRLVVIPLITLAILKIFMSDYKTIAVVLLIVASAPFGSTVPVYAQRLDKDYTYAVQLTCLGTVLSIITMPLIIALM